MAGSTCNEPQRLSQILQILMESFRKNQPTETTRRIWIPFLVQARLENDLQPPHRSQLKDLLEILFDLNMNEEPNGMISFSSSGSTYRPNLRHSAPKIKSPFYLKAQLLNAKYDKS